MLTHNTNGNTEYQYGIDDMFLPYFEIKTVVIY